jgi:hypothetical protein
MLTSGVGYLSVRCTGRDSRFGLARPCWIGPTLQYINLKAINLCTDAPTEAVNPITYRSCLRGQRVRRLPDTGLGREGEMQNRTAGLDL